jgi:hypothetical protein
MQKVLFTPRAPSVHRPGVPLPGGHQKIIKDGVDLMLRTVMKLVGEKGRTQKVLLLEDKEATTTEEDEAGPEDMSQDGV